LGVAAVNSSIMTIPHKLVIEVHAPPARSVKTKARTFRSDAMQFARAVESRCARFPAWT